MNNTGKGFGYAGVYADARARTSRFATCSSAGTSCTGVHRVRRQRGVSGNRRWQLPDVRGSEPSISVVDNLVSGVSCAGTVGVGNNTTSPQKDVRSVVIARNKGCRLRIHLRRPVQQLHAGPLSERAGSRGTSSSRVSCATGWMLPYCDSLLVSGKLHHGTATSSLIDYLNSSTKAQVFDNFVSGNLVGAARSLRYTDGD